MEISDFNDSCKYCGADIEQQDSIQNDDAQVQDIDLKFRKLLYHAIAAIVILSIGAVWLVGSTHQGRSEASPGFLPFVFIFSGLGWYLITRYRLWKLKRDRNG